MLGCLLFGAIWLYRMSPRPLSSHCQPSRSGKWDMTSENGDEMMRYTFIGHTNNVFKLYFSSRTDYTAKASPPIISQIAFECAFVCGGDCCVICSFSRGDLFSAECLGAIVNLCPVSSCCCFFFVPPVHGLVFNWRSCLLADWLSAPCTLKQTWENDCREEWRSA